MKITNLIDILSLIIIAHKKDYEDDEEINYSDFPYMGPKAYYNWSSTYPFRHNIDSNCEMTISFVSADDKLRVELQDLINEMTPEEVIESALGNVLMCDPKDTVVIINRYGNSKFYIADSNSAENSATAGDLNIVDINDISEEEIFQLSTTYAMPDTNFFEMFRTIYPELQRISTELGVELTIGFKEPGIDFYNIKNVKEEDFKV